MRSYCLFDKNSLERKSFVKLNKTQLFHVAIKLTKACTRWETKKGIFLIFFSSW